MKQELAAGIIMSLIGLSLVLVPTNILWIITERWKTDYGSPSKKYAVVMRILGIVFALAGGFLIKLAVK